MTTAALRAGPVSCVVVIAVARKLAIIGNAMNRDGTVRDPAASAKESADSAFVATSGEKPSGEAKPEEACKRSQESTGGQVFELEVSARGGSSRNLCGIAGRPFW